MRTDAAKRDPFGPREMRKWFDSDATVTILSAARGKSITSDKERMRELHLDLQRLGVKPADIKTMRGQWEDRPEPSLAIRGLSFEDAKALSDEYEQDAFIFKGEDGTVAMYSNEGTAVPVPSFGAESLRAQPRKPKESPRAPPRRHPEELFTGTRSNTFEFDFDWSTEIPLDKGRPLTRKDIHEHFPPEAPASEGPRPSTPGDVPPAHLPADTKPRLARASRRVARVGRDRAAARGRVELKRAQRFDETYLSDIDPMFDHHEEYDFDPLYELGGEDALRLDPAVVEEMRETTGKPPQHLVESNPTLEEAAVEHGYHDEMLGYETDLSIKPQVLAEYKFERYLSNINRNNQWPGARASAEEKANYARNAEANVRTVLDQASPETIEKYATWYQDAHDAAMHLAQKHGYPLKTVIGVIAALSPNTPWDSNLKQADHLLSNPSAYEEAYRKRSRLLRPFNAQIDALQDERKLHGDRLPSTKAFNERIQSLIDKRKKQKKGSPEYEAVSEQIKEARKARDEAIKADPIYQELNAQINDIKKLGRERVYQFMKTQGGPMYAENAYKALAIVDGVQPGETGLSYTTKGKYPVVSDVMSSSPASEAGLEPGMTILEIDGLSAKGMKRSDVARLLVGGDGESLNIVAQKGEEDPKQYKVTRRTVAVGPKVGDFHRSIMDPEGMSGDMTVDGHMINLARGTMDPLNTMEYGLSPQERQVIKDVYRKVAGDYGLSVQAAHAIAWIIWGSSVKQWDKKKGRSKNLTQAELDAGAWLDEPEEQEKTGSVELWSRRGAVQPTQQPYAQSELSGPLYAPQKGPDGTVVNLDQQRAQELEDAWVDPGIQQLVTGQPVTGAEKEARAVSAGRMEYRTEMNRQGEVEVGEVRPGDRVKFLADFEKPGWPRVDAGAVGVVRKVSAGADRLEVEVEGCSISADGSMEMSRSSAVPVHARQVALMLHSEDARVA